MQHEGKLALTFFLGFIGAFVAGISGAGVWSVLLIGIPMTLLYFLLRTRHTDGYIRVCLYDGKGRATSQFLGGIYIGTLVSLCAAYGLGWLVSQFL